MAEALSNFYLGKTNVALGHYDTALQNYAAAAKAGYNGDDCVLARAEAVRLGGDPKGALILLDGLSGAVEQTAEYLSQRAACVSLIGGNPSEVVALYERAVESDRNHPGACSGLPWRTTAAATTRPLWNCTSGPPTSFPPTWARS